MILILRIISAVCFALGCVSLVAAIYVILFSGG